jgi:hypothetical protein
MPSFSWRICPTENLDKLREELTKLAASSKQQLNQNSRRVLDRDRSLVPDASGVPTVRQAN